MAVLHVPIWDADKEKYQPTRVKAQLIEVVGFEKFSFAMHRSLRLALDKASLMEKKDSWVVVEASTGRRIAETLGPRYVAVRRAQEVLAAAGILRLRKAVAAAPALNPEFKPQQRRELSARQ